VRACRDGGLRPSVMVCRSTARGRGCASATCATRSPARRSVKSSGSSEIVKGVEYFPQVGNSLWRNPGHRADSFRSGHPRRGFGRVGGGAGSSMEGTSGAADLGLLRGSTGNAALAPDVSAQATRLERWRFVSVERRASEGLAGSLAQAGCRGSASSYPSRGWGSQGGIVSGNAPSRELCRPRRTLQPARPRSHDERCPSGSGWGSPLSRRPARAHGSEPPPAKAARWTPPDRASARPAPGP